MIMSKFVFGEKAAITYSRSKFDLSYSYKTTLNVGDLVPCYLQEVYPGDTFKITTANVCRALTPYIKVPMDNLFLDMYYFFVPNRLVFNKWSEVMGENKSGYWANTSNATVPVVRVGNGGIAPGDIADYFGISQSTPAQTELNALPFRANILVYNEWFRDQNIQPPVYFPLDNTTIILNSNTWATNNGFGKVPKANKLHDYFTSCLPNTQKGNAVNVSVLGQAPVKTSSSNTWVDATAPKLSIRGAGGTNLSASDVAGHLIIDSITSGTAKVAVEEPSAAAGPSVGIYPSNLYADMSQAAAVNVNDLRLAFQMQKMLEKDARGGTRYVEYLLEHFGVVSPDARLQRPEFLGGKRMPLSTQQVEQTSKSETSAPMAGISAYSLSNGLCGCKKSFVEHGFILGYAVIRQHHSYQQGIDKMWKRKARLDYYDPVFANIGEQPVYATELYAGANAGDVFGYNEAWADLRYRPSKITGAINSVANNGLDIWHFGDKYGSQPLLSDAFMQETSDYVDRALSAPSSTIPNFVIDFYHKVDAVRVLPVYSTPGLIDHN